MKHTPFSFHLHTIILLLLLFEVIFFLKNFPSFFFLQNCGFAVAEIDPHGHRGGEEEAGGAEGRDAFQGRAREAHPAPREHLDDDDLLWPGPGEARADPGDLVPGQGGAKDAQGSAQDEAL